MVNGYMGKILWVDLSSGEIVEEILDDKLCRDFIGGYGMGAKILFNKQKAGIDPLGPENILGFLTGPFTGTPALGGSRYVVVGKSPLTGTWGDANSGGYFGPNLKFAGFDGVFFKGISKKPLYLFINNGHSELRDASHLWGKDCYDTEDVLKSELGQDVEVACIGPAGEKVSLIAAIINNKGRAAGRSGLGAVMGSKKLKAIAVKGNLSVPLFDAAKADEIRKKSLKALSPLADIFRQYGTPGFTVSLTKAGDTPIKNWGGVDSVDFPNIELIGGDVVIERQAKKYSCYKCPLACGGHMKAGTEEYKYAAGAHKPEYETIAMFGANCLNANIESIIKASDICNRFGLDTISVGATIAMAIECYENGLINKSDTDGIELTWGNHKAIIETAEKIARREGFGNILADGAKVASQRIGKGAEKYAMHMQGQEYPAHDPKFSYAKALAYRMDATPARHTEDIGMPPSGCPIPQYDPKSFKGGGEAYKVGMCINYLINSAGGCEFVFWTYPNATTLTDFINAITGWNVTIDELIRTGERIADIRQAFTIREGLNPLLYQIPGRIAGLPAKNEGPLAGITLDEKTLDRDFCLAMDWDVETAKPNKKKLIELGMPEVAQELWLKNK
jgi:aldehyde:ferredoxin oxidoreductase